MSPWIRVVQGLFVGPMTRPIEGEFEAVLSIVPTPPRSDDRVHHRWLAPTSAQVVMDVAVDWVAPRWMAGGAVLIQSFPTVWADLAVGACLVHLGATPDEAITALLRARPVKPSDDQLRAHLEGR